MGLRIILMKDRDQEVQGGEIKRRCSVIFIKLDTVEKQRKSVILVTLIRRKQEEEEARVLMEMRTVETGGREAGIILLNIIPQSRVWRTCPKEKRVRADSPEKILTEVENGMTDSRMTEVAEVEQEEWRVQIEGVDRAGMTTGE